MVDDEPEQERGFKVQDRRRFSATGDARDEAVDTASSSKATPPTPETAAPPPSPGDGAPVAGEVPPGAAAESISFPAFIISLTAQALALLGEIPDPIENATHVDLEGARQIIDILGMLKEKTRGNLDDAEGSLLESALYDLRMKYVDRAHGR